MTGPAATMLFARLTWKRLLRGKALWISALLLALPVVVAITTGAEPSHWKRPFNVCALLLVIIPPLHLATAVSDEVDDQTFTYLWSRPIPRWSVVIGKLIALGPALAALMAIPLVVSFPILFGDAASSQLTVLARGVAAIAVGALATGMLAVGLGTLVTKFPLPVVIAFMLLFDTAVGAIPFAVNRLTISHNVRLIAGIPEDSDRVYAMMGIDPTGDPFGAAIWALALGAVWLGIALWRVSVAEYATKK